jgi:hypothetical protein
MATDLIEPAVFFPVTIATQNLKVRVRLIAEPGVVLVVTIKRMRTMANLTLKAGRNYPEPSAPGPCLAPDIPLILN